MEAPRRRSAIDMSPNNTNTQVFTGDAISRRLALLVMGLAPLSIGSIAHAEENQKDEVGRAADQLRKTLTKIVATDVSERAQRVDKAAIARIKDSYRNSVTGDLWPLCVLAAVGEWDFLLLVWCSTDLSEIRLFVLLVHLCGRDKDSRDMYFDFERQTKLFVRSEIRLREIRYVRDNLPDLAGMLLPIADKMDKDWAKALREFGR